jgi:hypothetical protein
MSHGMYEIAALLPASSDFTLERAVRHYGSLTFSMYKAGRFFYKNEPLRAELATAADDEEPSGFRVFYGDWAVVAWLDESETVLADSRAHAEDSDLPAPPEVIAGCSRWLWVCSDVDEPAFDNSDNFTDYTDELRARFGAFILDYVNGGWWT